MKLYLVQHAEAKQKEDDPERPLTEKGWDDIRKVACFAAEHTKIRPSYIVHSGKTRARQTAEVLDEHLRTPRGIKEAEGLDPLADPAIWAHRLTELEEDIMLVGHLPHLSRLSGHLLCQDGNRSIVHFQNAGIVCLGRDESDVWSIRWMVIPQILA